MPRRLIENAAFGPEVIEILGLAFDDACARAADPSQHETIAKRIIKAAMAGERDVHKLAQLGLNGGEQMMGAADQAADRRSRLSSL
jgi:hypothetical protein